MIFVYINRFLYKILNLNIFCMIIFLIILVCFVLEGVWELFLDSKERSKMLRMMIFKLLKILNIRFLIIFFWDFGCFRFFLLLFEIWDRN